MIEEIHFDNGSTLFYINDSDSTPYPVTSFESEVARRIEDNREKTADDGLWPTFPYDGGMDITIEGAILASDADDYTAKRNALTSAFRYKPSTRVRKDGTLYVEFSGVGHTVWADVVVRSISIPRSGESPQYSMFRIVLLSFVGHYIDSISGDPYYDE